jgi:hypothetical protein
MCYQSSDKTVVITHKYTTHKQYSIYIAYPFMGKLTPGPTEARKPFTQGVKFGQWLNIYDLVVLIGGALEFNTGSS